MQRPPVIAVSSTSEIIRNALRVRLNASYTRALERVGALPLIVPPLADTAPLGALLDRVDGLVLTGGEDVDPSRYGAEPHPELGATHEDRDATELALVDQARRRKLPTLAICRGIQLLNVALGGTLIQDIPDQRPSAIPHDPKSARDQRVHDVEIAAGSRLAAALGDTRVRANSFHHQALDRVADGLRVTARAPDGIIEGVEWIADDWWALGVQWHPEELVESNERWDHELFAALVHAARENPRLPN
ncbi:MAG TPA: gamma-glutamyl-gamma-aminobutyrate hydrolase family protein [Gemmatimonadaceae bacterium]|nr:gamma-glutamyl-gamma-aminobutyrate hydrolase family protein [Gemmatimonadaceae bacterium]